MKLFSGLIALVIFVGGCDQVRSISSGLDNKTEPTYWFWARLQGIEYRGLPEVQRLTAAAGDAARSGDVDRTAEVFRATSDAHANLAHELDALDPANVDDEATAYRKRLATAHREVADAYQSTAQATSERNDAALRAEQAKLKQALETYVATWNDRKVVMARLGETYSQNFDVQE